MAGQWPWREAQAGAEAAAAADTPPAEQELLPSPPGSMEGNFSYKQLRRMPVEVLERELRLRQLPVSPRRDQLASRMYSALVKEGRALNTVESAESDEELVAQMRSVWLFDCGEDTQRHLLRNAAVGWSRIDRIFISSLTPDAVLGLPGMLCTISASREKGHEAADVPVHVYGPPGLVDFVNTMLSISRTYIELPILLHELTARPPAGAAAAGEPVQVNKRARLYGVQLPPDQLNPEGYYDGEIRTMLARHTRKRQGSRVDLRAGTLPLTLPPPGDPGTAPRLAVADMCWTVRCDHEWIVRALPLKSRTPCFGFFLQEADRRGRGAGKLYADVAERLGIPPGDAFTRLKLGESVTTPAGDLIRPHQVVGPARPGRRVAVLPPALGHGPLVAHVLRSAGVPPEGAPPPPPADLVVAALEPAGAGAAGAAAAALGARELILYQHAAWYPHTPEAGDPTHTLAVVEEARRAFGREEVSLAGSFFCHEFRRSESDPPPELAAAAAEAVAWLAAQRDGDQQQQQQQGGEGRQHQS
eukprot:scaffold4.g4663.t1